MATLVAQTVTVYNKSGKAVSTSKHLVNVFKEAKSAYREKKAEIRASKIPEGAKEEPRTKRPDHRRSRYSSGSEQSSRDPSSESVKYERRRRRRGSRERSDDCRDRRRGAADETPKLRRPKTDMPRLERGDKDGARTSRQQRSGPAYPWEQSGSLPPSPLRYEHDLDAAESGLQLARRHSFADTATLRTARRNSTESEIDMDLAYGELPPPLPSRRGYEKRELKEKAFSLQRVLEESNCLQSSASAMIKHLQENPDAMAAVGLTLAEISNLVGKIGPAALLSLKGAFPAVVALLLCPEFLIAAGVGVGVTVISIGGYKIVKRIKAKKAAEKETTEEEIEEDTEDVSHIEHWRRGIDNLDDSASLASVEGEIVTPGAAKELREREVRDGKKSKTSRQSSPKASSSLEKRAKDERKKAEQKQAKEDKRREAKQEKHAKEEQKKAEKGSNSKDKAASAASTIKSLFNKDKERDYESAPSTA
ncbi:MAG: hypothetical protein M1828_000595 [Chrysothrix sp. TS-e1954]|nr:MAG: hypothetical protein M1828_000595 [Chrysothrix sp. TS-e1954]